MQILDFVLPHLGRGLQLIDRGLLGGELRFDRIAGKSEPLGFDRIAIGQFVPFDDRGLVGELGDEAVLDQIVVRLGFHLGLVIFRVDLGGGRFLVEQLALERRAKRGQLGFRALGLEFGIQCGLLEVRAGEFHDQRVGLDVGAWPNDDLFDPAILGRGDPANVFRHERAESAHLAKHRSALHRVDPDRRAIHAHGGRFQPRNRHRDEDEAEHRSRGNNQPPLPFLSGDMRARNIHG